MKKLMATLIFCCLSPIVLAQTDYQCVNDCTSKGYQYSLCNQRCSFEEENSSSNNQNNQPKQTDYQCVNDCTAKGYQYGMCTDRCSF